MRENLSSSEANAISTAPTFESETATTPTSGSDDWDWFAPVAWDVLGTKDAGQILHWITGYPLSTCRAYVAKERDSRRAPMLHFLRRLIRGDNGQPFHRAFMADCTAPWWVEMQRHAEVGRQVLEITKRE